MVSHFRPPPFPLEERPCQFPFASLEVEGGEAAAAAAQGAAVASRLVNGLAGVVFGRATKDVIIAKLSEL